MQVHIIDYNAGNLFSVSNSLAYLGHTPIIADTAEKLADATCLILPGVGAFGSGIAALKNKAMIDPIKIHITQNKPFIGLCLGFQLLFESSDESPGTPGLAILPGHVTALPNTRVSVPHIGWNSLEPAGDSPLPAFMPNNTAVVYFVHQYCVLQTDPAIAQTQTTHDVPFVSSIAYKRSIGCQFHPEKSGQTGIEILKSILETITD